MDPLHAVLVGWGHHGSERDLDIETLRFAGSERNSPNESSAAMGERIKFVFLVLGARHINGSIHRRRQVTHLERTRFGLQDGTKMGLAISAARIPHTHQHVTSQLQALGGADVEPYHSPTGIRAAIARAQPQQQDARLVTAQAYIIQRSTEHRRISLFLVINCSVAPLRRHQWQEITKNLLARSQRSFPEIWDLARPDAEIDFVAAPEHPGAVFLHRLRAVLADENVPVVVEAVLFAAGCKAEWYVAKWMVRM